MTGFAKNTIGKLLVELGEVCAAYQTWRLGDCPTTRVQPDEIWSFVYAKAKNVPDDNRGEFGYGDVWTWTALDADSKLMGSWLVGERSLDDARAFMADVAFRLTYRTQITTDGNFTYREASKRHSGPTWITPSS